MVAAVHSVKRLQPRQQRLEMQPPAAREDFLGLFLQRQRPFREQEFGAVGEFDQRLGAFLQAGQGGGELGALLVVEFGRISGPPGR